MIEYEIKKIAKFLRDCINKSNDEIDIHVKNKLEYGCYEVIFRRIGETHVIIVNSYTKTFLRGSVYSINELITMHIQCLFWTKMSFEEIFKIVSAV